MRQLIVYATVTMRSVILLCVLAFGAVSATSGSVDWSKVRPMHVLPAGVKVALQPKAGSPEGRITNGNLAKPKQFPYQVGLLLYLEEGAAWCGGSIISDRWVVTAAHCTADLFTGVDVYLGTFNRLEPKESGHQKIFVPKRYVIVHENFNGETLIDDISLIKTPVPIEFNDYIQPVQLPKVSSSNPTYEGINAIASGWGRISDQASGVTDKLRWIEAPIMKNNVCNRWFLGSVRSSNICINTTGGVSTCNGDSGGPLVLPDNPRTLIGITSFGIMLGCEAGWPGVFTRVTSYLDWIEVHTGVVGK